MTTAGLLVARARDALPVLAALAVVVVVATLALALTVGSVQNGVASGSRAVLDSAAPQSAAVRVETHLADDSTAQSDAALGMVAGLFPAGTVAVHTAQRSLPVDVLGPDAATAIFGVQPSLLDHATLDDGTWPAAGVAVQRDAAEALGLEVGDAITVGTPTESVPLTVAAVWHADDPSDAVWFADPTFASGRDGDAYGTLVVDEETLRLLPTQLFASWTITATPAALDAGSLDAVVAGLARLHDAVRATDGVVDVSSSTDGTLASTLERIADAGRGAAAIAASAIIIVGLLAVIAIVQLGVVLVGSRRRQSQLIRARGLSLPQLAVLAGIEALVIGVPATALGTVAAAAVLGPAQPVTLVAIAAGMVLLTAGCLVTVVVLDGRRGGGPASSAPSAAPFIVAGGLVAVAAAIATWQLYNRGSVPGVDLVGATSPALVLVAAAVLGTALFFPVASGAATAAARSTGAGAVLAARQIDRRVTRYLVPALSLAIAVASAVFATGLATTWAATERAAQFVGTGPDVAVALTGDGGASATSAGYSRLDGARAASALVLATVSLGSDTIPFVAVRPGSVERVLGDAGADAASALATTTPDDAGVELAADATAITASVSTVGDGSAPGSTFDVGVWAADSDGALSRRTLVAAAEGWTAPLPDGAGPWRLLAIDVVRTGPPDPALSSLTVAGLAGDETASATVDVDGAAPLATAEILPVDDDELPVVITDALAERLGLAAGDPLTLEFDPTGKGMDAVVSAVTPRLPGVASRLAMGTDLMALDAVTLRPDSEPALADEIWIGSAYPGAVAAAVAREATSTAIVTTRASSSSDPVLAASLTSFWLAAAAAALLALVALSAFFVDDFRNRRNDIAVLRALGFSAAGQTATRRRELVVTAAFAAIVGAVGGGLATALVVGPFIAAAVPTAAVYVRVLPAFDPLPWAVFCVVLAAAAVAVALALLVAVRRSASSATVEQGTA